jgi:hypothetical protein
MCRWYAAEFGFVDSRRVGLRHYVRYIDYGMRDPAVSARQVAGDRARTHLVMEMSSSVSQIPRLTRDSNDSSITFVSRCLLILTCPKLHVAAIIAYIGTSRHLEQSALGTPPP